MKEKINHQGQRFGNKNVVHHGLNSFTQFISPLGNFKDFNMSYNVDLSKGGGVSYLVFLKHKGHF